MAILLANNASSRLASSINTSVTTLSVSAGQGALFPSPSGGDYFPLTAIKDSGALEIMKCTARSGDVLTVTRAQESTTALAFAAGERVELRLTVALITAMTGATATAQTAADTVAADLAALLADPWAAQPIGVPIPVFEHLTGAPIPSAVAAYRYIKLTAADGYNSGLLTSETVSGSAPLVLATAVISVSGSPIDGQTVRLINTERRVIRAGSSGTVEADQMQGHVHAQGIAATANIDIQNSGSPNRYSTTPANTGGALSDGTNGTPRVGLETRAKNVGATFYMRVK